MSEMRMSVKDMNIDCSTGQAVKTAKRSTKGRASSTPARASAAPRRERRRDPAAAGLPSVPAVVVEVLISGSGADALGLGLGGREGVRRGEVVLADLLDLRVEGRGDLLPGRDDRRGERGVELGAEHLELLVRRDRLVLPALLQGGQVGGHAEPLDLHLGGGEVLDELPGGVAVLRALEDAEVRAAEEAGAGLLHGHGEHAVLAGEA